MNLTFLNRLKFCWQTLTIRSGHAHTTQEKQLSVFQNGYAAGATDAKLEQRARNDIRCCYSKGLLNDTK